jgi:hypothetical protein
MESPILVAGAASGYVRVDVAASPPARLAIEQFDASSDRALVGFGDGWHEQEFNPRTGMRWRWLSERGELRILPGSHRLTLHLEGESPRTYFSRGSRLVVRSGDRVAFDATLSTDFALDVPLGDRPEHVVLESDQMFVPAERSWPPSADRRHLGLRILKCELRSSP